ncbi:MAG: acetyltransferase [Pseudomonadota bacterium]
MVKQDKRQIEMNDLADRQTLFGLFGAGGFGREVMCLANGANDMNAVFVDDEPQQDKLNGQTVLSEADFWAASAMQKRFNVTIADPTIRKRIAEDALLREAVPHELCAQTATLLDGHEIAEGAVLCHNSIVGTNAKIGRFFHLNMNAYVAHDCIIGNYVTVSPAVCCCGRVTVGDLVFIGAGAVIRNGTASKPLTVGEGAVIGMGAVVTSDVPPYTTVFGNPAAPVTRA